MITVKFIKVHPDAQIPTKSYPDDAGFDVSSVEDLILPPHGFAAVATGLRIALPPKTEAQMRPRSGLAAKHGVTALNAPGTIDAGYRGDIRVILINHSDTPFHITKGMRIGQLVVQPVYDVAFTEVEALDVTDRNLGGFGSTGLSERK